MNTLNQVIKTENEIIISRLFEASIDDVWEAWKNPDMLKAWWAPNGCTTPHCKVDFRVGGKIHFCMRTGDGTEIWGLGTYTRITDKKLIEYTDSFADDRGNPVPPSHYGMSASHPGQSTVSVQFSEASGMTEVTLRHMIKESVAEREGMVQGWSEMFDRLSGSIE